MDPSEKGLLSLLRDKLGIKTLLLLPDINYVLPALTFPPEMGVGTFLCCRKCMWRAWHTVGLDP